MYISDQRGLEICRDGIGQTVLVDIYISCDHGIRGNNLTGSHPVRQPTADQCPVVRDTATHAANRQTKLP